MANSPNKRDLFLKVRVALFIEMERPNTEAESQTEEGSMKKIRIFLALLLVSRKKTECMSGS